MKRLVLSLLALLVLLLMWRDSTMRRSAASYYTGSGVMTAVHHGGKIDLVWSNVAIPMAAKPTHHLWTERSFDPSGQSFCLPDCSRAGERITAGCVSLPYWLIIVFAIGNIGGFLLIAETFCLKSPSH